MKKIPLINHPSSIVRQVWSVRLSDIPTLDEILDYLCKLSKKDFI